MRVQIIAGVSPLRWIIWGPRWRDFSIRLPRFRTLRVEL